MSTWNPNLLGAMMFLGIILMALSFVSFMNAFSGLGYTLGKWKSLLVAPLCFLATMYVTNAYVDQKDALRIQKDQAWIGQKCPVFKYECGGKHKYSCEIRTPTVGRYNVGDTIVESYPSC